MKYTLLYLPVDKPITEGCVLIRPDGKTFEYYKADGLEDSYISKCKVAELFFVKEEYNQQKIVGKPSPGVLKWAKVGESFRSLDCNPGFITNNAWKDVAVDTYNMIKYKEDVFIQVKCPTCGHLH